MGDAERLVQRVYAEAAKVCGDDAIAIARFVEDRLRAMSPDDRALFNGVAEAASSYEAPDASVPSKTH